VDMEEIPSFGAQEARIKFREALDHIMRGTPVQITRHGRVEAYLVPADWYRQAQELTAATGSDD
jgi:prevent-host-death family protein